MLIYPTINPVAFSLGPLKVHWYGLMYLLGFLAAWTLGLYRAKQTSKQTRTPTQALNWTPTQVSDLIFYVAIGVIAGGRLGYMLFYATGDLLFKPWTVLKLWDGGMSFHGGLIGVIFAMYWYGRKIGKSFWQVADFAAPLVPIGLALGRIGNFINGELWGRVTDMPWGMIFYHVDAYPRHPSQLYEFLLEGVMLFSIMWWYSAKPRPEGRVAALFLIMYGIFRFIVEFFREPDLHLGLIAFDWLSMGQLLSIPMIVFGAWIWFRANKDLG